VTIEHLALALVVAAAAVCDERNISLNILPGNGDLGQLGTSGCHDRRMAKIQVHSP
jgi:hypothetical protein